MKDKDKIRTPRWVITEALFVPEFDGAVDVINYVYNNVSERNQHMLDLYAEHHPSPSTRYEGEEPDGREVISWLHPDGMVLTIWIREVLVFASKTLIIADGVVMEV